MAHARPLDPSAVAYADKQYAKKYGPGKIDSGNPDHNPRKKEWWGWYDEASVQRKAKKQARQSTQSDAVGVRGAKSSKKPKKPVASCPLKDCCSLYSLEAYCEDYGSGQRKFKLKTAQLDSKLGVIAGSDSHAQHTITLKTNVRNRGKCTGEDMSNFYRVTEPNGSVAWSAGPDADIKVKWPGDLSQWYKYFFPFALDPARYAVSPKGCCQENPLDIEVLVYPDVEIKVAFSIDLRKNEETNARDKSLKVEYKAGKTKVEIGDIVDKVNTLVSVFRKTKKALDTVSDLVSNVGVKPKMVGPTIGIELAAKSVEENCAWGIAQQGSLKITGDPVIGIQIEADIIDGVLKVLSGAASSTGIGIPAAALLQVVNYGRRKLGAGIFFTVNGQVKGEIGVEIAHWPDFKSSGKMGGCIDFVLQARVAKEGTFFLLRWLSHARVGGQGGVEFYVTKIGLDKGGAWLESECAFTGLFLFYGKAKGKKTTTIADKGGIFLIEKKDFWKNSRIYCWTNGSKG